MAMRVNRAIGREQGMILRQTVRMIPRGPVYYNQSTLEAVFKSRVRAKLKIVVDLMS